MSETAAPRSPEASPQLQVLRTVYSAVTARLLTIATELGLPDRLATGPRPAVALAEETGTDPDALGRLLRTLAGVGIFTESAPGTFGLTPTAAVLQTGTPGSIRDVVLELGSEETFTVLGKVRHSITTGEASFPVAYGTDFWDYLSTRPARDEIFNNVQTITAAQVHTLALAGYDFTDSHRLVDVGAGHGALVTHVLERNADLTALLFDQPHVVAGARSRLEAAGVAERCEIVGGDFFESVPAGADTYVLSMILHDWPDDRARAILGTIRAAMAPGARLLVMESVIPEGDAPHMGKFIDIMMLMHYAGRERTRSQFETLFASAGLELVEVRGNRGPVSLLVVRAAGATTAA